MEDNNRRRQNDEIDLKELFRSIGDFFRNIGNGLVKMIASFRRATIDNKILLLTFLILAGLLGLLYKLVFPKYFEANLVLKSPYFTEAYLNSELSNLNELIRTSNYKKLEKMLGIDQELAQSLLPFEFEASIAEEEVVEVRLIARELEKLEVEPEVIEKLSNFLEIDERKMFTIVVRTSADVALDPLEKGLLTFLTKSSFIKQRIEINRVNLIDRRSKLVEEANKLDSLNNAIIKYLSSTKSRDGESSVVLTNEGIKVDPQAITSLQLEINEELLEVKKSLYLSEDFEIVDGLDSKVEHPNEGLIEILLNAVLYGIAAAYLVIALRAFNAYLSKVEKESV